MNRPGVTLFLAALALPGILGACGDPGSSSDPDEPVTTTVSDRADGTGFLTVQDLPDPSTPGHFTGEPVETTARLMARDNGCVNVVVDGVERVPLWPEGSGVAQVAGSPGQYAVTLPNGQVISVHGGAGDTFTALGLVDQGSGPFSAEPDPPGKVDTLLAFCGGEAGPISFSDATTFVGHDDDNS
jgi:hypothetical protein